MNNSVYLNDVLLKMSTQDDEGRAVPFSISFRTYNSNTKKGGRLIELRKAKLVMHENINSGNSIADLKREKRRTLIRKNPNHWKNKTRNIKTPEGEIIKVNIMYIITFNGQKVSY